MLKASEKYADECWTNNSCHFACKDGFRGGARWAIDELLKILWHPGSEMLPTEGDGYLLILLSDDSIHLYKKSCVKEFLTVTDWVKNHHIIRKWVDIDDLIKLEENKQ